jgi:uncharacterized integral membrane protein (TIGR00698 family)
MTSPHEPRIDAVVADRASLSALLKQLARRSYGIFPGLLLTTTIAGSAFALRHVPGIAIFSPMIISIVLGIAFHNIIGTPAITQKGIAFSLRRLLRFAIILLGLQLTVAQIMAVGASGVVVIVTTLVATFAFTTWAGRLMGVDHRLTQLIAAGTSICGASAVVAANTATHAGEEDVAYAVACVTVFGTIAMFVYPLLPELLHLDPHAFGLWTGSSIHEIAQVVAAAFQDGQQAGEFGTIAKLSRVVLLAPMVIAMGIVAGRRASRRATGPHGTAGHLPIPWFVLGFVALIVVNSAVSIPPEVKSWIAVGTGFLLSVALTAMGLVTDLRKLTARGVRPALLGLIASLFISGFSLTLIKLLG